MPVLFYRSILFFSLFGGLAPVKKNPNNSFHPLHVSTTDISYNVQDNKLEVICTIFTDDFELALQKQYQSKTDLQKPAMHAAMDVLVKNYLNAHLQIKAGNTAVPINYLGFELNREAINVYLESEKIPVPKKIEADVSLLHNIFDDQLNIVHITVNGVRKSGRIDYPDRKIAQTF
jgi:hypothetical protein